MIHKLIKWLLPLLAFIIVFTELGVRWWDIKPGDLDYKDKQATGITTPLYHEQFISYEKTSAVHAPAISLRRDGKLLAIWYAGTREGAGDVEIHQTIIDPDGNYQQSPPRPIISRQQTQQDTWRYIRKLGNPIIHTLPDGRLMLVYAGVSFGGWAASRLYLSFSHDDGQTWRKSGALVTSPFLNISTLVKGAPIIFDNGDIGIPVYHEFIGKFGELLILDSQGNIKNKRRISWGRDAIQPVIVPLDGQRAIALLRDSGEKNKRVSLSKSEDSGYHWTTPAPSQLPNPNAAVALATGNGRSLLAVFNNDPEERYDMSLAISKNEGEDWRVIHAFDKGVPRQGEKYEFSYPYLISDNQGGFHLVYTWHKKRIKYVHFNQSWLEQQL